MAAERVEEKVTVKEGRDRVSDGGEGDRGGDRDGDGRGRGKNMEGGKMAEKRTEIRAEMIQSVERRCVVAVCPALAVLDRHPVRCKTPLCQDALLHLLTADEANEESAAVSASGHKYIARRMRDIKEKKWVDGGAKEESHSTVRSKKLKGPFSIDL
ncbi:hypothetical protein AXG93_4118s1060 [Marchantia polymorpha subsp. ruderalis]|uniref:Uncharacterized protein n=1 Tax=Marchantia polymorpha subsp. ruderalis TaxID=1480154 RepID=A0A176W3B4_MARPO|nr:hypothetical protein AXG93_4118s1060 [Marchantia polymorpha subsp. ruderalis]